MLVRPTPTASARPSHGDNPSVTLARATLSLRLGHLAVLTVPRTVIHYRSAASLPFAQGRHGNLQAKEIFTFSQGENISHLQSKYFTRAAREFHSPQVNFTACLQAQARIASRTQHLSLLTFSQGENISHLQSKYFTRPMDEFHSPKVNFTAPTAPPVLRDKREAKPQASPLFCFVRHFPRATVFS